MNLYTFDNKLVTISSKFLSPAEYTVTISTVQHGTITAVPMSGLYGTTVTLSNTPDSNYQLDYYTVNGNAIVGNTFTLTGDVTVGGSFSYADPYNPLGLPDRTMRCQFTSGYTPSMGTSRTLVDASTNTWDIYYNNANWELLFKNNSYLTKVIGANATNITSLFTTFEGTNITECAVFDTSNVTNIRGMFYACRSLTYIPLFPVNSVTNCWSFAEYCTNVEGGALDLYNALAALGSQITIHKGCFYQCGINTTTGAAELAQIPEDWKVQG